MTMFDAEFLKIASIPLVAGAVGWFTNWLAVKFMFYPLEFVGIPPYLGWQGVIPSKSEKMSNILVDNGINKLGSVSEFFHRMEPELISSQALQAIDPRIPEIVDSIAHRDHKVAWENLPSRIRKSVYKRVRQQLAVRIPGMLDEIGERIDTLADLKELARETVEKDKTIPNRIFQETGEVEFRFLVNSGFWFGMMFGLVQMVVWIFFDPWWVLPLFGALVGYATNWIALKLIFEPLHPRKIGPFTLHGMFLKRQQEISSKCGGLFATEVLTIEKIMNHLLYGSSGPQTQAIISKHMRPVADEAIGRVKPFFQIAVGPESFANIRENTANTVLEVYPDTLTDKKFIDSRSDLLGSLLGDRMAELPADEFQGLLRPAFQEDEMKLILVGCGLGFLAGLGQFILVFGGFA